MEKSAKRSIKIGAGAASIIAGVYLLVSYTNGVIALVGIGLIGAGVALLFSE